MNRYGIAITAVGLTLLAGTLLFATPSPLNGEIVLNEGVYRSPNFNPNKPLTVDFDAYYEGRVTIPSKLALFATISTTIAGVAVILVSPTKNT